MKKWMVPETETATKTGKTHKSVDEYVEILRELGGEAGARDFADAADRDKTTLYRRFVDDPPDDCPIETVMVGDCLLYRLKDESDEENSTE